ncbi:MAG: MBL fold metallo-hydrolase [Clostridia bacterium]|nr:MBL fold metallo-hydrolase [Clostridia bacterium]
MIKFCNLYSGSSGNSTYIETDNSKILIDAGVSCQKISKALSQIGVELDEINAILVTHEHIDHTKGLTTITKKFNTPVYATSKTWTQMSDLKINPNSVNYFSAGETFQIGDIAIHPFSIPHDAVDPCAFSIMNESKKITVATDIGHVEDHLIEEMVGSDILLIESNYDRDTLLCGSYPYFLKKRIASDFGHLSNEAAAKLVKKLYENGVTKFVLGHLSKENNFPELAYQTVLNELTSSSSKVPFQLSVANREYIDDILEISN